MNYITQFLKLEVMSKALLSNYIHGTKALNNSNLSQIKPLHLNITISMMSNLIHIMNIIQNLLFTTMNQLNNCITQNHQLKTTNLQLNCHLLSSTLDLMNPKELLLNTNQKRLLIFTITIHLLEASPLPLSQYIQEDLCTIMTTIHNCTLNITHTHLYQLIQSQLQIFMYMTNQPEQFTMLNQKPINLMPTITTTMNQEITICMKNLNLTLLFTHTKIQLVISTVTMNQHLSQFISLINLLIVISYSMHLSLNTQFSLHTIKIIINSQNLKQDTLLLLMRNTSSMKI